MASVTEVINNVAAAEREVDITDAVAEGNTSGEAAEQPSPEADQ